MALQNAFGDIALDQTLQELRDSTQEMTRLVSAATRVLNCMRVDSAGRLVINIEASSNTQSVTGGTVAVNGTVTANVGTSFGPYLTTALAMAAPQLAADSLRRNIVVS